MALAAWSGLFPEPVRAQAVPHNQDRPPGPPLSSGEAQRTMTVPDGFRVEIFACEPDIVNPVSMTFDPQRRVWITESLEYPRKDAGPGRDRIKVLEDRDGNGKADRFTVFAEGLNIPCGIAIGSGGVFVTNSPDILFLEDSDGDLKADRREVVLTGFGRNDTHELPNTLTWGPDGWLYGLNGVFNSARVRHRGKEHRFDAALWRYHPRTRDFELFAEGTSNPWGLAFDSEGSAFVSACVIDHLFHLAEGGYYHRQAGPYPPFTWKIESIVQHQHQKAAYCGLALYDAEVYPERYRGRLFLGNIHGNSINVDRLEREGSSYRAFGEDDFLSGNDVWFMPVSLKLAPDGCLYVLDWYDRYHCYQDAQRDPQGIDRLKGRLYRIAYRDSPRPDKFDLGAEPDQTLLGHLSSTNLWWRDEAKRLLSERLSARKDRKLAERLRALVLDESAPRRGRVHALWTLVSAEDPGSAPQFLEKPFQKKLLTHRDPTFRAFGVRAAGNSRQVDPEVRGWVGELARDPHPDVRLQVAVASRKLFEDGEALPLLLEALAASEGDTLIPRIVWRNLAPLLETRGREVAAWFVRRPLGEVPAVGPVLGRVVERLLGLKAKDLAPLIALLKAVLDQEANSPKAAEEALLVLGKALSGRELDERTVETLRHELSKPMAEILAAGNVHPVYFPALQVAAAFGDPRAREQALALLADRRARREWRARSLDTLVASRDPSVLPTVRTLLHDPSGESEDFLRDLLSGLGRLEDPGVASIVLESLEKVPGSLRPGAIDLLTQRPAWAAALLEAVDRKRIDRSTLHLNQVKRILSLGDEGLRERVSRVWGQVRMERNRDREEVMARMRKVLKEKPGDPWEGKAVFEKNCLQCHTMFGKGQTVGPDITVNGRETLEALLSNLLDPNLVIGKDYYAWSLLDRSGRILTGLLVEDSLERVVLRVAGGKEESVLRKDIRSLQESGVSLMPEDLERTLKEEEFRDLIAYLRYEEAPPEPVPTRKLGPNSGRLLAATQEYGRVTVSAQGTGSPAQLLSFNHSNDGRPFIHPLRAPGGGPVLTASSEEDLFEYGVFTAHPRVNGIDFWHGTGWIQSRGLELVEEHPDRVEILSRSDWLSQRLGGKRILSEVQGITVHVTRGRPELYRVDLEWRLTPDEEVTLGKHEYGGLALRAAHSSSLSLERAGGLDGQPYQSLRGKFRVRDEEVAAGVALFDHPGNPGFPHLWRDDQLRELNPAITARGPQVLPPGKTTVFRYRLLVHRGPGDRKWLEDEYRAWANGGSR